MVNPRGHFSVLSIGDESYPPLLKAICDPPEKLFLIGSDAGALLEPVVAIVGSRKSSEHGRRIAAEIASSLAANGVVVASGMAYGIDAAAHRGALHAGGKTIAVMGCGIDIVYPDQHRELAGEISANGVIATEYQPGTIPYPANFPRRNRIISGLSLGVVVVEAAEQSGSLITARLALEQGREVFAVPGRAGDPAARGTNMLIRDWAALVECGEDVIAILRERLPAGQKIETAGLFENDMDKHRPLLRAMQGQGAVCVDWLVRETRLEAGCVLAALTELVVAGRAMELPGRRFRLKGS